MSTAPTTQHRAPQITKGDGSMVRVLVVDDEHSLTELLKMALRYEGWDVRTAAYGEMLLDSLRWDAVLPYTTREIGECFILQDVSHIAESSRVASAA